jgi:hypothetical protein
MITVVVAGMGKERISQLVEQLGDGRATAQIRTDLEAATAVKSGRADYYIGACQSGAGGALAVANAILGSGAVARLSGVGMTADPEAVRAAVTGGKRAFGISYSQIDEVVPMLMGAIFEQAD